MWGPSVLPHITRGMTSSQVLICFPSVRASIRTTITQSRDSHAVYVIIVTPFTLDSSTAFPFTLIPPAWRNLRQPHRRGGIVEPPVYDRLQPMRAALPIPQNDRQLTRISYRKDLFSLQPLNGRLRRIAFSSSPARCLSPRNQTYTPFSTEPVAERRDLRHEIMREDRRERERERE